MTTSRSLTAVSAEDECRDARRRSAGAHEPARVDVAHRFDRVHPGASQRDGRFERHRHGTDEQRCDRIGALFGSQPLWHRSEKDLACPMHEESAGLVRWIAQPSHVGGKHAEWTLHLAGPKRLVTQLVVTFGNRGDARQHQLRRLHVAAKRLSYKVFQTVLTQLNTLANAFCPNSYGKVSR